MERWVASNFSNYICINEGSCGSGVEVAGSIPLVCMSKCPWAKYWTPNCSWCAGRHLAWQPPPSVYEYMPSCAEGLCQTALSVHLQRGPVLWKSSCLVLVPKKGRHAALDNYRPIALTSHIMKVIERLVLAHLRPLCAHHRTPYRLPINGVNDAIIYLLQ